MKKLNITTDMIIGVGLCIALIIALIKGSSTEICIGIASNLGGYMGGRFLMTGHLSNNPSFPPTPQNLSKPIEKGAESDAEIQYKGN